MKKVLVVVDVQKDFYHPDGALYVKGGEVLPERIAKVIPQFYQTVFTMDSHPFNHCSFKENGGIWPKHCVRYSEGFSLPSELLAFATSREKYDEFTNRYIVEEKGDSPEREEYGAFSIYKVGDNTYTNQMHGSWVVQNADEVVFCGIAGDYCVKETIKNVINHQNFNRNQTKVKVYLDGVASIDDGTTIREFMKENNIEEWKPQE